MRSLIVKGCPNFNLLNDLYGKNLASGRFAASSIQSADENGTTDNEDSGMPALPPPTTLATYESSSTATSGSTSRSSSWSTPDSSNSSVVMSPLQLNSSTNSAAVLPLHKRLSADTQNGERPKRAHYDKADQFAEIERGLENAMALYNRDSPPPTTATKDRFSAIPEVHQLSLRVSQHLGSLLTRLNGKYSGMECNWLSPRLLFRYCQVFDKAPVHAAMFFCLPNDQAAVEYLHDLYDAELAG